MDIAAQDILVAAIGLMLCAGALVVIALPILALVGRKRRQQAPPDETPRMER